MKTFEHSKNDMLILKAFDKNYTNVKGQQPILVDCKVEGLFFEEKPQVDDIINSFPFGIDNMKVVEILENHDAKKTHYPKVVNGIEYTENDLKRPEAKGVHFNHEKAYFVLKLEA